MDSTEDSQPLITVFLLCLLIVGESVVGYSSGEGHGHTLLNVVIGVLCYLVLVATPLFIMIPVILKGAKPQVAIVCAWVCIVVGGFIQIGFHQSHDPSRVMLIGISLILYWLCGTIALFSYRSKQH